MCFKSVGWSLLVFRILQISLTNTPAPSEPLCLSPAHHGQKTGRLPRVQSTHEACFWRLDMLLVLLSAETECQGWPSLHSCHINIDMCTYSFYMFVLYTSIPRWCFSIGCHPDSSRFSQLDPLAAWKSSKNHQTKTREITLCSLSFMRALPSNVVCFFKAKRANFSTCNCLATPEASFPPSISRPCRSCLRAGGSTLELLQGGLNLWKLWNFPTSWEHLCHQLRSVCLYLYQSFFW